MKKKDTKTSIEFDQFGKMVVIEKELTKQDLEKMYKDSGENPNERAYVDVVFVMKEE